MKICFVTHDFKPESGHAGPQLMNKLSKRHAVTVLTTNKLLGKDGIDPRMKVDGLKSFVIKTKQRSIYVMPSLFPRLLLSDADVFHLRLVGSYASWAGSIAGNIKGTPMIMTLDWNFHDLRGRGLKMVYNLLFKMTALRLTDKLVVYTEQQKEKLMSYEFEDDKIVVISNGIDYERFSKVKKSAARAELGLDPNKKVLLTVGRISPEKNLEMLIRAFSKVRKRDKNVSLVIVGPKKSVVGEVTENYYRKLRNLVKRLKLTKDVIFYGPIKYTEIQKAYAAADVFALSSKAEGFANVSLQSAASGTPFVTTPVGIGLDLMSKKECGIISDDLESFSDAIGLLLTNNSLRDRMGRNGKKIAKEYSWTKIVSKYEKLYKNVAGKN